MKRLVITILGSSLLLFATLLALSAHTQSPPVLTGITPNTGPNDRQTPITITGQGFTTATLAYLDDIPLLRVTFVDSATLQARVPFGLVTGVYTLTVTDMQSGTLVLPGPLALTNAFTVTAGSGWATGGPYGGRVPFLVVHPTITSTVYAIAEQSSVFRTTDGARHWELVMFSPVVGGSVVPWPVSPTMVFAGGREGLYRSEQLGDPGSWTLVFSGTGGVCARTDLAIAPNAPYTMYAALGGTVYHSADGGTSWQTRTLGLSTGSRWWILAVDPTDAATAYAASSKGGDRLYQTTDAGQHWTPVYTMPQATKIQSVATDPYSPTVVWLGTNGQGLHRSIDSGKTFRQVTSFPSQDVSSIRTDPNRYRIFVASNSGLYASDDGGDTWQNIHPVGGCPGDVAVTPGDSNTLYACWLEKTADGGQHWSSAIEGIAAVLPRGLAVSPRDPRRLLLPTRDQHGYESHNGGNEWTNILGPTAIGDRFAVFDPVSPTVAYIDGESGVYKTIDDGQSWQPTGEISQAGLPRQYDMLSPQSIGIHPLTHTTVYVGVYLSSSDVDDDGALYRSDDGGDHWTLVTATGPISSVDRIIFAPGHPETIYLNSSPGGFWRSRNGGQTWEHPIAELSGRWVRALTVSPDDPSTLLAGGGGSPADSFGIWRSTNGGDSWQPTSGLIRDDERLASEIAYDPADTRIVYAATEGGLRYSVDSGQSWKVYPGSMGQIPIKPLAIVRHGDQTYLYLVTAGGAVAAQPTMLRTAQTNGLQTAQTEMLLGGGVYVKQGAPPPMAGFTAAPTSGVRPLNVVFADASTGIVTDWLWDFGDTFTSTQTNPTHIYSTTGVYTVALTVSGPDGTNPLTRTNYITVTEPSPVPKWVQRNTDGFGDKDNSGVTALEVFNGQLYASTTNYSRGALIRRSAEGITWTAGITFGFGTTYTNTNPLVFDMTEFKGQLYAGAGNWSNDGVAGQIWRAANGTDWTQVEGNGFGSANNTGIVNFGVFSDTLYACTFNTANGLDIWRSSTGNSGDWTRVISNGFTGGSHYPLCTGLAVFDGHLYAAVEGASGGSAQIWRTQDGITWNQVNTSGFGDPNNTQTGGWATFNGYLYVGIRNDVTGAQLWHSNNGLAWTQVISNGLGDVHNFKIESLMAFDGYLYAATDNNTSSIEVWRSGDGTIWERANLDGFGDRNNVGTLWSNATAAFNNRLYIGTANGVTGGEIWQKAIATDFAASPISGAVPLAVTFTNLSDGDYTSSLWNLGDGITSTQTSLTHSYTKGGVYTVTLTVSDDVDTSTLARTNYVTAYSPVAAGYAASPTSGLAPLTVIFTNTSTGDYTSSLWDLGDEVSSTLTSPAHIYAAAGVYTVTLTVSGPGGMDTLPRTDYIRVLHGVYLPLVMRNP